MNTFILNQKLQVLLLVLGLLLIELPFSTMLFAGNSPAPNLQEQYDTPVNMPPDVHINNNIQTIKNPDGTIVETLADGTKIIKNLDGSVVVTSPDGTVVIQNPDGSSVRTETNGIKIITNSDGSAVQINRDGTKIIRDVNGNLFR